MTVRILGVLLFLASAASGVWAACETERMLNIATEVMVDPLNVAADGIVDG